MPKGGAEDDEESADQKGALDARSPLQLRAAGQGGTGKQSAAGPTTRQSGMVTSKRTRQQCADPKKPHASSKDDKDADDDAAPADPSPPGQPRAAGQDTARRQPGASAAAGKRTTGQSSGTAASSKDARQQATGAEQPVPGVDDAGPSKPHRQPSLPPGRAHRAASRANNQAQPTSAPGSRTTHQRRLVRPRSGAKPRAKRPRSLRMLAQLRRSRKEPRARRWRGPGLRRCGISNLLHSQEAANVLL